jgi:aromatic-L-amino-acid decarboxylase
MTRGHRSNDPLDAALSAVRSADHRREARPVSERVSRAVVRDEVSAVDLERGSSGHDEASAVATVAAWLERWGLRTGHPQHFGYANASSDALSTAGEVLASAFDAQCALWESAPAAVELERAALAALAKRCGFRSDPDGSLFTTGASEALAIALGCALVRACPASVQDGVFALGARPTVYASVEAHRSITKCARALGWGESSVVSIGVRAGTFAMDVDELAEKILADRARGARPIAVVATAGSTVCGAVDDLEACARLCEREGLWLHVDGAWGAGFALCDRGRRALAGASRADSVAWDASKFPGLSVGTGMLFLSDSAPARALYGVRADYVAAGDAQPYARGPQWSRRAIGLKVFLSLAVRGLDGWAREAERRMALGDRLREGVLRAGFDVRNESELPVLCLARRDRAMDERAYARWAKRLLHARNVWVSAARTSDGLATLRAAIVSSRTDEHAVDALVRALEETVDDAS